MLNEFANKKLDYGWTAEEWDHLSLWDDISVDEFYDSPAFNKLQEMADTNQRTIVFNGIEFQPADLADRFLC